MGYSLIKKIAASDFAHQNTASNDISPSFNGMISHQVKPVKGESYHPSVGAGSQHLTCLDTTRRCQI